MEPENLPNNNDDIQYDKLAVLIKTKTGQIYQVALNQEMSDVLFMELSMFFDDGVVKICENEIKGIDIN
jgi:hypothetical protein